MSIVGVHMLMPSEASILSMPGAPEGRSASALSRAWSIMIRTSGSCSSTPKVTSSTPR